MTFFVIKLFVSEFVCFTFFVIQYIIWIFKFKMYDNYNLVILVVIFGLFYESLDSQAIQERENGLSVFSLQEYKALMVGSLNKWLDSNILLF